MKKLKIKQNKAITLIALVITIIILLILAGVTIASLTNTGLFGKTNEAKEASIEAQLKEEIEMAIMEIQIDKVSKGENVTLETLKNELPNKLEITAELNNEEITGEYKGYNYKIDGNFTITIEDGVQGISFSYKLNPEGYTNGNITLTITASSTNGEITNIQAPDTVTTNEDGTYTITANGDYEFTVTDNTGASKTQTISIGRIDKLSPKDFLPVISEVKSKQFTITVDVTDEEDETNKNAKSGIERYEYYINGTKYNSEEAIYTVTGLNKSTQYTVYVIAYDKAGNFKKSGTVTATTTSGDYPTLTLNGFSKVDAASDALPYESYDNNFGTFKSIVAGELYYKIDPECWGKYITFYNINNNSSLGGSMSMASSKEKITTEPIVSGWLSNLCGVTGQKVCARSVLIPEGAYWGYISSGTMNTGVSNYVYEVWCSEEDLSGNTYSNDNLPN